MMDAAKKEAMQAGLDVIDLSTGASDLPCPIEALKTLSETISDASTHSCETDMQHHMLPFMQHKLMHRLT
jgi:hypothetical protein